jgi:hypothetical protein
MDIDLKTYPSRAFIRFTARNQLIADATGRPMLSSVKRLGSQIYLQEAMPEGDVPSVAKHPESYPHGLNLGMSLNSAELENIPCEESCDRDELSSLDPSATIAPEEAATDSYIDEDLFEEVIKTTFNPNRFPDLYRSCGSRQAAMDMETDVVAVIVANYRHIQQKRECPIVQSLNQLL